RVLDMCAAPGGKSTALGAQLRGRGVLVANDISASRCRALIRNLEGFGIVNALVTNAVPARLTERFGEYFDKVLVDAPCSGEGMFRKDEGAVRAWYPEKNEECARIQRDLVLQAADMLRPGGRMVYSTCTFAPEENEEIIAYLLQERPHMRLLPVPRREGFAPAFSGEELRAVPEYMRRRESGMAPVRELTAEEAGCCVRLWPHRTGGEGHFLALFEKDASAGAYFERGIPDAAQEPVPEIRQAAFGVSAADTRPEKRADKRNRGRDDRGVTGRGRDERGGRSRSERGGRSAEETSLRDQMRILYDFGEQTGAGYIFRGEEKRITIRGGQANLTAAGLPDLTGIPVLHNGLYLGEVRKDRFEPSQSLAMALSRAEVKAVIDLPAEDERVQRYLRGETLNLSEDEILAPGGWQLVCAGGYPLGWGRLSGTLLKNKYHPGWRQKV
ncbi:MAG: RsmB/NOP family class I SAM-dependent RNA methyltransferase, partial [Lachnospiraceae bacterium]|nr:RsmB/NOP family class I SAM-dependent RNA methyltransferase [Lachnospiraceae bacterium]